MEDINKDEIISNLTDVDLLELKYLGLFASILDEQLDQRKSILEANQHGESPTMGEEIKRLESKYSNTDLAPYFDSADKRAILTLLADSNKVLLQLIDELKNQKQQP